MTATFTKLKQSNTWGVRIALGPQEKVTASDSIVVRKSNGSSQMVQLDKIIWSGPDKTTPSITVALATIVPDRPRSRGRSSRDNAPSGRTCPMCGERGCPRAWNSWDLCQED